MKKIFSLIITVTLTAAFLSCTQNRSASPNAMPDTAAEADGAAADATADAGTSVMGTQDSTVGDASATGEVRELTAAEFREKVMDYVAHPDSWVFAGKRPVVIDMYATWCGPCKRMSPIVEKMAARYAGKIDFYKIDIDREQELAQVFGVQSIPMFIFAPLSGKPTARMGAMSEEEFEDMLKNL